MSCLNNTNCPCNFKIKNFGTSDLSRVNLIGTDRTTLNWSEISVPEILPIPALKPDIESIDQVYVNAEIGSIKLIATPFAYQTYRTYFVTQAELDLIDELVTTLAAFPTAAITSVAASIDALVVAVNLVLAPLLPNPLLTPITSILTQLSAITAAIPGLLTDVTTAITGITGLVLPLSICSVTSLLQTLYDAIDAVDSILTEAVTLLNQLVVLLGTVLETLLPGSSAALIALITPILTAIAGISTILAGFLTLILSLINQLTEPNFLVLMPNEEGTILTGRKLIVEGDLNQKIVYTANVDEQSVHSAHFTVPFSAFVIPYANFEGLNYAANVLVITNIGTCTTATVNGFPFTPGDEFVPDLNEEFTVNAFVEDIFVYPLDPRTIFKNITLFLQGKVAVC